MIVLALLWVLICVLTLVEEQKHGRYDAPTKVSVKFALYDPWIGFFHDRAKRVLYLCPLPCVLIKMEFVSKQQQLDERLASLTKGAYDDAGRR